MSRAASRQANLLSLALALAAVSCASALPPPPSTPELLAARRYREILARAGQLHAGEREAFIEAFAQATRPAVLVDVLPNEDVEAQLGELFPIGLDDFLFLHVQVGEALPDVILSPHVAVMADTPKGPFALPMSAPIREV